eukprot:bmy_15489T0
MAKAAGRGKLRPHPPSIKSDIAFSLKCCQRHSAQLEVASSNRVLKIITKGLSGIMFFQGARSTMRNVLGCPLYSQCSQKPMRLHVRQGTEIISAILKIQSTEGRKKAFYTCASHLAVVVLCCGMANFHLHPAQFQPLCPSGEVDLCLLCHFDAHAESHDLQSKE